MTTSKILMAMMLVVAACGGSDAIDTTTEPAAQAAATTTPVSETAPVDAESVAGPTVAAVTETSTAETPVEPATEAEAEPAETAIYASTAATETFTVEVWADNWMAFYVNGELVAEDSVSITTERSFNAEVFTFEAARPFTIAIEAKDFKETDSGLEYIGERNQQMGDGGIIAQVTNAATGEVVAVTDSSWSTLVVHRAPLNTSCEKDSDPDVTCQFEITETPADWATVGFDDAAWSTATEWSEQAVSPKDGYDQISWDGSAQLVWGTDLEVDNTVLLRSVVSSG